MTWSRVIIFSLASKIGYRGSIYHNYNMNHMEQRSPLCNFHAMSVIAFDIVPNGALCCRRAVAAPAVCSLVSSVCSEV